MKRIFYEKAKYKRIECQSEGISSKVAFEQFLGFSNLSP